MNAVKLLNLTVLEPFVNDMTILTASMGTFEQYQSRKRRMLYHLLNGDGFSPCLS